MRPVAWLYLLLPISTLACTLPRETGSGSFLTKHPEYAPPNSTPDMEHAMGLNFTGHDPRRYLLDDGESVLAYMDSLPRCPYEEIRKIEVQGDNQREALESLLITLHESAADAVIGFTGRDSSWAVVKPSTMTQARSTKNFSKYLCRGTAIRFTEKDCGE